MFLANAPAVGAAGAHLTTIEGHMGSALSTLALALALLWATPAAAADEEELSFDVSEFETRAFEFGGYAEVWPEILDANPDGALYQLTFLDRDREDTIDRFKSALELEGRYHRDIFTLSFRTHSDWVWDYRGSELDHSLYEGVMSLQPTTGFTVEAGKKANRWGKGLVWNPVGFVERPKDPDDPNESREGFWMAGFDWIRSFQGPLRTLTITPLIVPTLGDTNEDFGETGHVNPAAKLYLLYLDTDIDLLFLGNGSRTPRFGVDFAKNLAPNFEIHGEFAYITDFERVEITPSCRARRAPPEDVVSYLLGMRYRTDADVTYAVEYYYNEAGNSREQQERFFECVHTAWEEDDATLLAGLPLTSGSGRGPFTRPTPMRNYLHFRAFWNEPFDVLYFTPGLQALYNLDDGSYSIAPELNYDGIDNVAIRLRATFPVGDALTEWGEKLNNFKLDLRVRYFF